MASAAPPSNGSWNITGLEAYSNQVFVLGNITDIDGNATDDGNVTVAAGGVLLLDNVTLVLPFHSIVDIQGVVVIRNSTIRGETWLLWVQGQAALADDLFVNATYFGSILNSTTSTYDRLTWDCGGSGGTVHLQQAMDFKGHTLRNGCVLSVELAPIASTTLVEIAYNQIVDAGGGTGITFADSNHTGFVTFNIHDLNISNMSGWGIYIGDTMRNTTFNIHDNKFSFTGSASVRADDFDGQMHVWNCSFFNVLRAVRMDGLVNGSVVATIDNITAQGTTDSIWANEMTWVIRNSTIQGAAPQFDAGTNGHIRIYDSVDSAFQSNYPGANGSIEHFITLNMAAPTWQNAIPITDDLVSLLDASGGTTLTVNASTWAPQQIVWWGMYPGSTRVDNRQLFPKVRDAGISLNCTPASFLVTQGMPLQQVTCIDDSAPALAVLTPSFPRIQNFSMVSGTGRVTEAGSGLTTTEFSLDGVNYQAVSFVPGDARNFTFSLSSVADGTYRVWLRAYDRTANLGLVSSGLLTIDTVIPILIIDPFPPLLSGLFYLVSGETEANTTVTVSHTGGFANSSFSVAGGWIAGAWFDVGVELKEGLNTYAVTARDAAGNSLTVFATTLVDTRPPSLVVLLDGRAQGAAYKRDAFVSVEGWSEANATVRVNGQQASRTGEWFAVAYALETGRTNLTVEATDPAGNTATWTGAAYSDNLPPALSATVEGAMPATGVPTITKAGSSAVAGRAFDGETGVLWVLVNGEPVDVSPQGAFSLAFPLIEGRNQLVITASDATGNLAVFRAEIIRDTTRPILGVSFAADEEPIVLVGGQPQTRGATALLVISANENITATFAGDNHALREGENSFVVDLVEGRNVFAISASDGAGNAAAATSVSIDMISARPTIGVNAPSEGTTVEAAVVEIVGFTDPLTSVKVNGQPVAVSPTGEFRTSVALNPGNNAVLVETTDALGNTNSMVRHVTSSPPANEPLPTNGDSVTPIILLVVGLAAGAGAGLVLGRARRKGAAPVAGPDTEQPSHGPRPPPQ